MGLLTKPLDKNDGDPVSAAEWNALKNAIYDTFGSLIGSPSPGSGEGLIDNSNVKTGAQVDKAKIADTAAVLGNSVNPGVQTITRPTNISGSNVFLETGGAGWSPDLTAGDIQAAALVGAAQNVALAGGKSVVKLTSGAAASLSTISGGVEGQKVTLVLADANTTVNHTATNTVNTIHLNRKAAVVGDAGMVIVQLTYSAALTGTGQWWEI